MHRVDLHDVLDVLPNANFYDKGESSYIAARCVFHSDSDPSMMVNSQSYVCLSCGAHGATAKLLDFLESGKVLPSKEPKYYPQLWRCLQDGEVDVEDLALEAHHRLMTNYSNSYYLKQRGIEPCIKKLLIGYYNGWYTFPIISRSYEIMGMVARASETTQTISKFRYMTPPSQPTLLYVPDWKLVDSSPYLIVVYGIIDAISMALLGFPTVSFSQGHKSPPELLREFRKRIYIIPDGDMKDEKAVMELYMNLDWRGKIIDLPYFEDTKDCNEIVQKYGGQVLKGMISMLIDSDKNYYKMRLRAVNNG